MNDSGSGGALPPEPVDDGLTHYPLEVAALQPWNFSVNIVTHLPIRTRHALVIHRPSGATCRHDQLAADGPGLVRSEERRDVRNLGRVDHAADGVAAW